MQVMGVLKDTGLTGPSGSMSVLCIPWQVVSTGPVVGDRYGWALARVDPSRPTLDDTISTYSAHLMTCKHQCYNHPPLYSNTFLIGFVQISRVTSGFTGGLHPLIFQPVTPLPLRPYPKANQIMS